MPFWITDVSMACQNLLLLLEERGLGALYFGVSEHAAELFAELGVPEGAQTTGVIAIGHKVPTRDAVGIVAQPAAPPARPRWSTIERW